MAFVDLKSVQVTFALLVVHRIRPPRVHPLTPLQSPYLVGEALLSRLSVMTAVGRFTHLTFACEPAPTALLSPLQPQLPWLTHRIVAL